MLDLLTSGRADVLRFRGLRNMVGNTPLIALHLMYRGEPRTIYAKAENLNLTGSIKDRIAAHIMRKAWHDGLVREGGVVAEATSGNTGISFSAVGRAMGLRVRIFMPDWMSQERKDLIRSFGAEIQLVSREEGGFLGSIALAEHSPGKRKAPSFPASSRTTRTPVRITRARAPRSGGSSTHTASCRTRSWPASAPGAR